MGLMGRSIGPNLSIIVWASVYIAHFVRIHINEQYAPPIYRVAEPHGPSEVILIFYQYTVAVKPRHEMVCKVL